eukprot:CAMPEP_0197428872 /NCGR_PEP_ID=MMETSP1170-20131217/42316_1 /TAXON_ID=54406 /ORGANISM="Sarcinochrysis sp, Strain CCMP770" /LENGTH=196 /DNA_ID=CAMNT_0042956663 /DNA_START=11 /DNA_END=602 /DNA_ORIENTATION=-
MTPPRPPTLSPDAAANPPVAKAKETRATGDESRGLTASDRAAAFQQELQALTDLKAKSDAQNDALCRAVVAGLDVVKHGLDIIETLHSHNQATTKATADHIAEVSKRFHGIKDDLGDGRDDGSFRLVSDEEDKHRHASGVVSLSPPAVLVSIFSRRWRCRCYRRPLASSQPAAARAPRQLSFDLLPLAGDSTAVDK